MIGCNVSTVGGICSGIERAFSSNLDCIQIYTSNSRTWNVKPITESSANEIRDFSLSRNVKLVTHIPFLVNIASPETSLRLRSIDRLKTEIYNAKALGIDDIVMHPGSYSVGDTAKGIERIIAGIFEVVEICERLKVNLLLETMSGCGTQIGFRFEELSYILSEIKADCLAVCFDTAHVYSAGYDISSVEAFKNVIYQFDKTVGCNKIKLFHINNTNIDIGKKTDRHSPLFSGKIDISVFEEIVKEDKWTRLPKIIEQPKNDNTAFEQVKYLKNIRVNNNDI
jgi:deoxyribonuclease-4